MGNAAIKLMAFFLHEIPTDNGYYLYGEVMPVIPPHTCQKDKRLFPKKGTIIDNANTSSETTMDRPASSMRW